VFVEDDEFASVISAYFILGLILRNDGHESLVESSTMLNGSKCERTKYDARILLTGTLDILEGGGDIIEFMAILD